MIRTHVAHIVDCGISELVRNKLFPAVSFAPAEIVDSRNPEHGDYSCNIALTQAKLAGIAPRIFAEKLQEMLNKESAFAAVEVAGPGFLNFCMNPEFVAKFLVEVLAKGEEGLAKTETEKPLKLDVEFVSVNPNGPITVGSGRGAAFGDTLCRVFAAAGHEVTREYYINDGLNSQQMRMFAESVLHYCRLKAGRQSELPADGYKGDYVQDVADKIWDEYGEGCLARDIAWFQITAQTLMLEQQQTDLARFGARFDVIFGEQTLHDEGIVQRTIEELKQRGLAYEQEGALWLRTTTYGDDKDRVLVRADGRPTYIASDIAYHRNKFERGYDKLIDILGPDHHGYIGRLNASVASSGYSLDRFEIVIYQIVRFMKDGKPAPMRKRDGNIYELKDLMDEVGPDVARFFYLMRDHNTHMDFDIDLAIKQSDDNPVFYVQYAHARICSVMRKAEEQGLRPPAEAAPYMHLLVDPREQALVRKICDLPFEAARCATDYGVHRLTTYAVELARIYHHFYDSCRVIQPESHDLSLARLALCEATRVGLRATFGLLGISAPERMERQVDSQPVE